MIAIFILAPSALEICESLRARTTPVTERDYKTNGPLMYADEHTAVLLKE